MRARTANKRTYTSCIPPPPRPTALSCAPKCSRVNKLGRVRMRLSTWKQTKINLGWKDSENRMTITSPLLSITLVCILARLSFGPRPVLPAHKTPSWSFRGPFVRDSRSGPSNYWPSSSSSRLFSTLASINVVQSEDCYFVCPVQSRHDKICVSKSRRLAGP